MTTTEPKEKAFGNNQRSQRGEGEWGAKTWTAHLELDLGDLRAQEVGAVGHQLPRLEQQHPVLHVQDVWIRVQLLHQIRKPQDSLEEWQSAGDPLKSVVSLEPLEVSL